jgi:hypothetical protein
MKKKNECIPIHWYQSECDEQPIGVLVQLPDGETQYLTIEEYNRFMNNGENIINYLKNKIMKIEIIKEERVSGDPLYYIKVDGHYEDWTVTTDSSEVEKAYEKLVESGGKYKPTQVIDMN